MKLADFRNTAALSAAIWIVMFAFAAALVAVGDAVAQDLGTDAQRADGKKIYDKYCAQCHGDQGDGNGVAKEYFWPTPRDFTFGMYKIRTTESGALPSTEDIKKIIKDGMPYTGMPAWPSLNDNEITNVAYYLKSFTEDFADPDFGVVQSLPIPKPPGSSPESIQRGREIYVENRCSDCHGDTGHGDGKSSTTLTNDWSETIKPADLTRRWTFRGGSSKEDIYRTFTTGLNGTPMPSYADLVGEEDRWHLVNYVYSLSPDELEYSTVVVATMTEGEIDVSAGVSVFESAEPAYFPVFGQIMEPGRSFFPSSNGVEVRAVYNDTEIAFLLTWSDMVANTDGSNSPLITVPNFDPASPHGADGNTYSDAVAIQVPSQNTSGSEKPYFLFGDAKNSVNIWFADLAKNGGELFIGRGSGSIDNTNEPVEVVSSYADGQWNVVFKRSRQQEGGLSFDEGVFIPIAFSVWDGFENERGNRRGVTSWYNVYLKPAKGESKVSRIASVFILVLVVEILVIHAVRRKNGLSF